MTPELRDEQPGPLSAEDIARLTMFKEKIADRRRYDTLSFRQTFKLGVSDEEAWERFQEIYNPDRLDLTSLVKRAALVRKQLYQQVGIEMVGGKVDCTWNEGSPPPPLQFQNIDLPLSSMSWISGGGYAIIRITQRGADHLLLWELMGKIK